MTSSDDWAAGICCPVTFSLGCSLFQAATIFSPQVTSWVLLEYQMLIGPCALAALLAEMAPPPPQAAKPKVSVTAAANMVRDFIVFPSCWGFLAGGKVGSARCWPQDDCQAGGENAAGRVQVPAGKARCAATSTPISRQTAEAVPALRACLGRRGVLTWRRSGNGCPADSPFRCGPKITKLSPSAWVLPLLVATPATAATAAATIKSSPMFTSMVVPPRAPGGTR